MFVLSKFLAKLWRDEDIMMRKALREFPIGAKLFWNRCSVVPFEASLGVLAIWTGSTAFLNWTLTNRVLVSALPDNMLRLLNLLYLISGIMIVTGVGWAYRNVETSGLIFLATSFIVRFVVLISIAGVNPETVGALVQTLTFGLACAIRIRCLLKNCILVFASDIPEIIARQSKALGVEP